jgi:hypothetical protein
MLPVFGLRLSAFAMLPVFSLRLSAFAMLPLFGLRLSTFTAHPVFGYNPPCSAVGTATGYGLEDREVGVRVPVKWVPGALSPGIKRQGSEADHSPPTSADVKITWIYTSTPPYVFMAQCLIR